ncbi:hypothetical protein ETR37_09420 [Geobacillus sp. PK12]|nr:hypothetical protein ETR37_09420 [Geobacillus sp. PK12]
MSILILLMVPHRCDIVISHGRTNELPSSVVLRNVSWLANGAIVKQDCKKDCFILTGSVLRCRSIN